VRHEFYAQLIATMPAHIQSLTVGGSVDVGSSITTQQLDNLVIGGDLDINLYICGIASAPAGTNALGVANIGGSLPQGITLAAGSISSLSVGTNGSLPTTDHNLAGSVEVYGNLGTLFESLGSITTTGAVQVAGNLGTLTVGPGHLSIGQDMAGLIQVVGTLSTASIAGGTPGLFVAGHVETIATYGGFGPIVLRVIEAGVQRWLEEDPTGQVTLTPNPNGTAAGPVNPNSSVPGPNNTPLHQHPGLLRVGRVRRPPDRRPDHQPFRRDQPRPV
jgi:hypothetical protein